MKNNDETCLYIINDDYELLGFNDYFQALFPNVEKNMKCYKVINKENSPCKNCPLKSVFSSGLFYNEILNRVVSITTSKITFNNEEATSLIGTILNDDKLNSDKVESHVIFEINDDLSLTLLHAVKPIISKKYTSIDDVINYTIRQVYVLDKERFIDFFNKNNLNNKTERFKIFVNSVGFIYEFTIKELPNNSKLLSMNLISREDSYQDIKKIHNLTKIYYQNYYFDLVLDYLNNSLNHSIIAIDIKHFKMFNEWYGEKEGDKFLSYISDKLQDIDSKLFSFSGYIQADNFVSIVEDSVIDQFLDTIISDIKTYKNAESFPPYFGIYKIDNYSISPRAMYDRAAIAITHVGINHNRNACYYNNKMLFELENEHTLTRDIERGLREHEFCFYLQPQCNMYSGKIVSAEALVRWNNKDFGLVPPIKFIPILEKNGGIIELDKYVWREVFIWLKTIIERNIKPVPISINVSRVDMELFDVPAYLNNLSIEYSVDPSLIEIEITESAYSSNINETENIVKRLHEYGFKIAMDDFGSGYSSLNMLNKINIDILKLDMKFLDFDEQNLRKGINILESVITMIKNMRTPIIVEGVETDKEQSALIEMGCRFAQGYFYHKPMPVDKFELLLSEASNMDYAGVYYHSSEKFYLKDFFLSNLYSDTLLNNILGPVAEFKLYDNTISIYRINNPFFELFNYEAIYNEDFRKNINHIVYYEDFDRLIKAINEAKKSPITGSIIDFRVVIYNQIKWLHTKIFYLKNDSNNKEHYIGCFEDITKNKEQDSEIKRLNTLNNGLLSLEKLRSWEYSFETDTFTVYFYNKEPFILNNASYNLKNGIIINKDYSFIIDAILERINNNEYRFTYEFPISFRGVEKWCQMNCFVISNENNPKHIIGLYKDLSERLKKRLENTAKSRLLVALKNMSSSRIIVNLNTDLIYHTKLDYGNSNLLSIRRLSTFLNEIEEIYFNEESKIRIKELLDSKLLIDEFNNKRNFKSFDCTTKEGTSKRICIYLKQFDDSNDIFGYFYFIDLDKKINNQNMDSVSKDLFPFMYISYDLKRVDCNDMLVELLNFKDKEDFLANKNKIFDSVVSETDYLALKKARELLKNVGDSQSCEFEYKYDDGRIINIYMLTRLLEDDNHEKYYLSTYVDVTNNKLFEKALLNTSYIENVDSGIAELTNRFSIEDKVMFSSISSIYSTSFFVNTLNNTVTNIYTNYEKLKNYHSLSYNNLINIYLEKVSDPDKNLFVKETNINSFSQKLRTINDKISFIYSALDENNNECVERLNIFASGFNHNDELTSFVLAIEKLNN